MTASAQITNHRIPRIIRYGAVAAIGLFILAQFARFIVPEFKLDNPPVTHTVNWDSPETERLWNTACADCHSNETNYPWYSYIAPVGWLVAHDTHDGRRDMNISTNHKIEVDEMLEVVEEGEMPLPIYTLIHTDARLSDSERQLLMNGLQATFGDSISAIEGAAPGRTTENESTESEAYETDED